MTQIPGSKEQPIDRITGQFSLPWRRWLEAVNVALNAAGSGALGLAADIATIATALGSPDGTVANIPDQDSLDVVIYGRNGVTVTGKAGVSPVYVELQPVEDAGTGTFKLLERDDYGRLSGTVDGAAADVPYDNTASGLVATDVQAAIDEVAASGGPIPTGTGWRHVTAGIEDAAATTPTAADVGALPVNNPAATGTGSIDNAAANTLWQIKAAAGFRAAVEFFRGTVKRWQFGMPLGADTFNIKSFDATGVAVGDVVNIDPLTRIADFPVSPTVPTATAGDNSTKAASTAFVAAAIGSSSSDIRDFWLLG